MITANDLRIGDLFEYEKSEGWKKIVIHFEDIRLCFISNKYFNNRYRPIPLTEKILLDCGFKKRKHLEDYFIELSDNCILSVTWNGVTFICGSNQQRILLPMTTHLHDLQNIFYSLTKTELTINL